MKNADIKVLRSLKDKSGRESTGMFLVEGKKMILEALGSGLKLKMLIAEEGQEDFAQEIGNRAQECHIVPRSVLESISDTKTPQGVCGAFGMPRPLKLEDIQGSVVALDGVQDPGNVGTIWRTADAAGLKAILLAQGCADPLSPKVQRAAMGSGFRVPFLWAEDFPKALSELRARGMAVVASALDGEDFYAARRSRGDFALIVGNEARGISEAARREANIVVKLPMRGGAESLNAAVAAGILMYALTEPCK